MEKKIEKQLKDLEKISDAARSLSYFRKWIESQKESLKRPLSSFPKELVGGDVANFIFIKRHLSSKKPEELWGRLGLAKVYRESFPSDEDFWNSDMSLWEVYQMLKAKKPSV